MTPDEKEIMALTIETAMLKGFERFAETMDEKISGRLDVHKRTCVFATSPGSTSLSTAITHVIKDWRTIVGVGVAIAWVIVTTINSFTGTPSKFTPEMVRQIAQQVQETTSPEPIKRE